MRWAVFAALALLCACGPNVGRLEKGERGTVARVENGDTLVLDSGLRVFLAEIEAPRRDAPYAQQSTQELEALTLHRPVQLAYGGTHRWQGRRAFAQRTATNTGTSTATSTATAADPDMTDGSEPSAGNGETAIAHVYVQSEGGRWIWVEQEMIARGAAWVHARHDNHARAADLLTAEIQARAGRKGLWGNRDYAVLSPTKAVEAAQETAPATCRNGRFALVEGTIASANVQDRRASLDMEGAPFSIAIFGQAFSGWDGPALSSLSGKRVRVRGSIGMFHDAAQICVDDSREIEVLTAGSH